MQVVQEFVDTESFIRKYEAVPNTAKMVRTALKIFFYDFLNPELLEREEQESDLDPETFVQQPKSQILADVTRFVKYLESRGLGKSSRRLYVGFVLSYLETNGVEYNRTQRKDIYRVINAKADNWSPKDETPFSYGVCWEILQQTDMYGKAYFTGLISSGARKEELRALTFGDIDIRARPVRFVLQPAITKTDQGRVGFLSDESVACLMATTKLRKLTEPFDSLLKVYPLEEGDYGRLWSHARHIAGYEELDSKGRHIYRIHGLRSFCVFRLQSVGGLPYGLAHRIIGHSTSSLSNSGVYDKWSLEEMSAYYRSAMTSVEIGIFDSKPANPEPLVVHVSKAGEPRRISAELPSDDQFTVRTQNLTQEPLRR